MSDEETVFIVSNPYGAHQGRMHSDKECSSLQNAVKNVLEKPKSILEPHREMCKWCSGENESGSSNDPFRLRDMLLEMDPEDV